MPTAETQRAQAPRRSRARGSSHTPCGLPLGRRTPRGRVRWYPVEAPEGRERALCGRLSRLLPGEVLAGVLAPAKERWEKRGGAWLVRELPLYRGYLLAATPDPAALAHALSRSSLPVGLVGSRGHAWAPLADEAAGWLLAAMDAAGVVRSSTGAIEGGRLRVLDGPLVGQEALVSKVDRHRRSCLVRVPGGGGSLERLALEVPAKT